MNAIILLSGGLDSGVTAYYVKKRLNAERVLCLFFDYGQRALREEEFCSRKIAKELNADFKKINLSWLGEISTSAVNIKNADCSSSMEDLSNIEKEKEELLRWWVPCRNSIFVLNALAHAESLFISKGIRYDIFIGLKNEGAVHFKDSSKEFLEEINRLAEQATHHGGYRILAPLMEYDKDEVIKIGEELGLPWQSTYSCYAGGGFKEGMPVHCGACFNCLSRKKAFYWANINEPTIYEK
ncbi:7-cyano-7-deazaguanine synthase [archaeon]|nr:7-cyano-7-deazaguanine synthase [archaeon]